MNRRTFLASAASLAALPVPAGAPGRVPAPDPTDATLHDLRAALEAGTITSRRTVETLLRRIRRLDRRGPALHAVITVNPDAISLAAERDAERRNGRVRGPLHGLPILIKDNIDTGDRQPTTAGSLALAETTAPRDAHLVRRLREAGAVILGKTNLSEWANFRSTRSISGWSAAGGQTRNPYALTRNPSGSSSGSGAAVAAGYAPAALGTETDGSIVSPSHHCSVVGLKPTVGLVSRSGIVPISRSQDTAGPMTRTVADAALLLGVLAGEDPDDPATRLPGLVRHSDYTRFLERDGLRGARLGVVRQAMGRHPEGTRLFERQLDTLRELGAVLIDPVEIPTWGRTGSHEIAVLQYEFKSGLAEYLATRGDTVPYRSLADLIAFHQRHADRELRYFGQEQFLHSEARGPLTDPAYLEAREACRRLARDEGIHGTLDRHRLDAFVAPTESDPAGYIDILLGDRHGNGCSSLPAVAGCPHLTVPAGYVRGLPLGLSFFGRAGDEGLLLRLGFAYEQATRHRRPPAFLPDATDTPPTQSVRER